ncbi:hypothetical protein NAI76_12700, partial [Francisella tularensis subsp. holarctica]|nr:hypothetical protein [Francisella tularensis subsp. holarctica]
PMLGGMDCGAGAFSIANISFMAATGDYVFEVIVFVNFLLGILGPDQKDIVMLLKEKYLQYLT